MDTLAFFQTTLPADGWHHLFLPKLGSKHNVHISFTDLEEMAKTAVDLDAKGLTVYHACMGYREKSVDVNGKKKSRDASNYKQAKSLWIDIDCGLEKATQGKGYPSQREAAEALSRFVTETRFPKPILVSSGYGLHAYWAFDACIGPKSWARMAKQLEEVLSQAGLIIDTTRTTDGSSVLRPPGTHNYKRDGTKPVRLLTPLVTHSPQAVQASLLKLVPDLAIPAFAKTDTAAVEDLTIHQKVPQAPCYGEDVAAKCQQVKLMRDTLGDVGYEHWRGVIGVLKYCEDGRELADLWSSERANTGHAQTNVEQKWNTWGSPPTTCEFFQMHSPGGCDGCIHREKIKSPIVLGRRIEAQPGSVMELVVAGETAKVEIPPLPQGYVFRDGIMARLVPDKDDLIRVHPFSPLLFYPTHRIRKEDHTYELRIRAHLPKGRIRDFPLDTGSVGTGGQKLIEGLGRHEVLPSNNKDASVHLSAYLRDSVHKLINEVQEIQTHSIYGWRDDGSFLIGDRQIMPDGNLKIVLLSGNAAMKAETFEKLLGTTKTWVDAVDWMYNRPGMEPMQYAICSGFGSLLGKFVDPQYNGIPLAITGEDSGRGKTTVCQLALTAFGHHKDMMINTAQGATENAMYALMSTFQNIPLLADELTNAEPEYISKLLYASSNGQDRHRLQSYGGHVRLAATNRWNMSMYLTANKHLTAVLALKQANTEAESVRVLEIRIDEYKIPKLKASEVASYVTPALATQGNIGLDFIRFIVRNPDVRQAMIQSLKEELFESSIAAQNQKYRFYRNHLICTIVAGRILHQLGFVKFNIDTLLKWGSNFIEHTARETIKANTVSGDVALSAMISDLSPSVLVSRQYRSTNDPQGPETVQRIIGKVAGRFITEDQKLYLNKKSVREWCTVNRVSEGSLQAFAAANNITMTEMPKFHLGRGITIPVSYADCIEIDLSNFDVAIKKLIKQDGDEA